MATKALAALADENCGCCRFFALQDKRTGAGVCRRYPPSAIAAAWLTQPPEDLVAGHVAAHPKTTSSTVLNIAAQFPPMMALEGWCGEFDRRLDA